MAKPKQQKCAIILPFASFDLTVDRAKRNEFENDEMCKWGNGCEIEGILVDCCVSMLFIGTRWRATRQPGESLPSTLPLPRKIISYFLFLIALWMPHTASAVSSMLLLLLRLLLPSLSLRIYRQYLLSIYRSRTPSYRTRDKNGLVIAILAQNLESWREDIYI